MPLLEARSLSKYYPLPQSRDIVRAVDGVDLTIEPGETVGLVGESGSGKSTLGRCILRLVEPSAGTVTFDGINVIGLGSKPLRALRRRMQIVFQDPFASLDPRWRIGSILDEPLRVHGIVPAAQRPAMVRQLLTDVGLPAEAAQRFPHEFSGGQRQRIGIARALAVQPQLIIADEPVSALDVSVRAQVLNLLIALRRDRGIAILFIGHDLGVVRQISHRVAVMYRGRIVEEGPTDMLYENPRHPYTRALLAAVPRIGSKAALPDTPRSASETAGAETSDTGCPYRARCPYAQPICAEKSPPLAPVLGSAVRRSACHFADTLPS